MLDLLLSRKTTPEAQSRGGLRDLVQRDLFALARGVLYKDSPTPMTEEFHMAVCQWREYAPNKRNLYLLARDHLKTSLITIAGNVQRILRDPQVRILLASNKATNAQGQLAEIKGHLQNPWLVWAFPDILWADPYRDADRWATESISVKRKRITKEDTIETIGVEGAVTGKHYDHGSFDDLVDEQNSKTRDQIESVIRWYETTQSLFEPNATQEIVGTPWEFHDLYAWLIEQKLKRKFRLGVYRQPCWEVREPGVLRIGDRGEILPDDFVTTNEGHLLPAYSTKHTRESLEERHQLNNRIFAAQWLLRPVDDESALFPRSKAIIRSRRECPDPSLLWSVMAVDPAISVKSWADYSALAVLGFDPAGYAYALDIRRGRWTASELVDQVYESWMRNPGIKIIGFESVGFQKLFLNEFRRAGEERGQFLPIVKLERDTRVGKSVRIRAIEPWWKNGQLILTNECPALADFLEEAERFRPWGADHDDMLDAVADCLQLRVRPEVPDPLADIAIDETDLERLHFLERIQAQEGTMDPMSLKNAWNMERRRQAWQEAKDAEALQLNESTEFTG